MKCNNLSNKILDSLKIEVDKMAIKPQLNIIQVGDRPDSNSYIKNKVKKCNQIGIETDVLKLKEGISQRELEEFVKLKSEERIPCFVQLPLPSNIDENRILDIIKPNKDVDGFTDLNAGRLLHNKECMLPCTPKGILMILKEILGDNLRGKNVLIINRSNIVGKPLALMLLQEDCTVTIAHSKTNDLKRMVSNYDVIVTAIGKPNFFDAYDFDRGQIIIDVSINRINGKLCGDISKDAYSRLEERGVIFTEVPNGVGVMTVTALISQIVDLYKKYNFIK